MKTVYPLYEPVTFTIERSQNEWVIRQAQKRLLNKSIIIREAIELLKKEYDNGKANNNQLK